MAIRAPLSWLNWIIQRGWLKRPEYFAIEVSAAPDRLDPGVLYHEVRSGHPKWAHLACPKCGEHIQLQTAKAKTRWRVHLDWLNRPTVVPSIWETQSCGAHFFITRGKIRWVQEDRR
jgi:hypothetical protein